MFHILRMHRKSEIKKAVVCLLIDKCQTFWQGLVASNDVLRAGKGLAVPKNVT